MDELWVNMTGEAFMRSIAHDNKAIVLDVRNLEEFSNGHLPNAVNIPFTQKKEFLSLDKKRSYYLYCQSGGRSALVAHFMTKAGFPKVINLNEGIQFWPLEELSA